MNARQGFTLIELLVVISIIGLLSSVVLVAVNNSREKAKMTKALADLSQFSKVSQIAQTESSKRLMDITGSNCSDCICRGMDIRNISISSSCFIQWQNALTAIVTAAGPIGKGAGALLRDPWGSPYNLDENEREGGSNDCRTDTARSVGPDGVWGTSDDISIDIPLSKIPCP